LDLDDEFFEVISDTLFDDLVDEEEEVT